jgi:NADPH:quinone reductase-like Zn-dependent oxidoreductase
MRRLVSEATEDGALELRIEEADTPRPGPGELLVKLEAAPVNPSDLALLVGPALPEEGERQGDTLRMPVPEQAKAFLGARLGQKLGAGNEGAGTVVAAGEGAPQEMIGKRVAAAGGDMYAEYRCVPMQLVMPLPEGASAREGASSFVNPMTALSMTEVMKRDGSPALVHTAAASNLGQMLQRIAKKDGFPLVNIVRSPEQQAILKDLGADHALNLKEEGFMKELVAACDATGATVGFDAVGGGDLAGKIITAMEISQQKKMTEYSRYGSSVHKQVYVYGRLDLGEVRVPPSVGMAWGVGGFLLTNFLASISQEQRMAMAMRVASEMTTTFASHYTGELTMDELLEPEAMAKCNAKATGTKYLLTF